MIEFSQLLSQHIHNKNIKTYALAQYCGLDRANMYKIINGKRKVPSANIVDKIANYMQLSPIEKNELEEAYAISLIGQDNYHRRRDVLNFFSNFTLSNNPVSLINYNFNLSTISDTPVLLSGSTELDCALLHIISQECTKDNGHIRLLVQPDFHFLMNVLGIQGNTKSDIHIEHIICLNNNAEVTQSQKSYNLNCLTSILPLYSYNYKYTPYYYYDNILSKLSTFTLFPYMVVTSEYVCLFTSDLKKGFMTSDHECIKMFISLFDEYRHLSSPLLKRMDTAITQMEYIERFFLNHGTGYSFQMTPCITPFLTPHIIERCIKKNLPNRTALVERLNHYISKIAETQGSSYRYIFSLEGVKQFLATGRVSEYPQELYDVIEYEDRIYVIKQLIKACKTLDIRMLKKNIGDIENELYLFVNSKRGYLLFHIPLQQRIVYLDIEEPGLLFMFLDFCENMVDDMFYSTEEMIRLLAALH